MYLKYSDTYLSYNLNKSNLVSLGGTVGCAVQLETRRSRVQPPRGRQHSFVEIDHEIFSTVILSLPLIQEGRLSVSGERICTLLEDWACPINVWLGKLTALDMTPLGWLGRKTSTQTNKYLLMCVKLSWWLAKSVDPDQTPHTASDLGLPCLLR